MILIVKEGNGDFRDNYYECVIHVFQVDSDITSSQIQDAYYLFIENKKIEAGIDPKSILFMNKNNNIVRNNPIGAFIKENYNGIELTDIHEITI
jgi:hypothetical protein